MFHAHGEEEKANKMREQLTVELLLEATGPRGEHSALPTVPPLWLLGRKCKNGTVVTDGVHFSIANTMR